MKISFIVKRIRKILTSKNLTTVKTLTGISNCYLMNRFVKNSNGLSFLLVSKFDFVRCTSDEDLIGKKNVDVYEDIESDETHSEDEEKLIQEDFKRNSESSIEGISLRESVYSTLNDTAIDISQDLRRNSTCPSSSEDLIEMEMVNPETAQTNDGVLNDSALNDLYFVEISSIKKVKPRLAVTEIPWEVIQEYYQNQAAEPHYSSDLDDDVFEVSVRSFGQDSIDSAKKENDSILHRSNNSNVEDIPDENDCYRMENKFEESSYENVELQENGLSDDKELVDEDAFAELMAQIKSLAGNSDLQRDTTQEEAHPSNFESEKLLDADQSNISNFVENTVGLQLIRVTPFQNLNEESFSEQDKDQLVKNRSTEDKGECFSFEDHEKTYESESARKNKPDEIEFVCLSTQSNEKLNFDETFCTEQDTTDKLMEDCTNQPKKVSFCDEINIREYNSAPVVQVVHGPRRKWCKIEEIWASECKDTKTEVEKAENNRKETLDEANFDESDSLTNSEVLFEEKETVVLQSNEIHLPFNTSTPRNSEYSGSNETEKQFVGSKLTQCEFKSLDKLNCTKIPTSTDQSSSGTSNNQNYESSDDCLEYIQMKRRSKYRRRTYSDELVQKKLAPSTSIREINQQNFKRFSESEIYKPVNAENAQLELVKGSKRHNTQHLIAIPENQPILSHERIDKEEKVLLNPSGSTCSLDVYNFNTSQIKSESSDCHQSRVQLTHVPNGQGDQEDEPTKPQNVEEIEQNFRIPSDSQESDQNVESSANVKESDETLNSSENVVPSDDKTEKPEENPNKNSFESLPFCGGPSSDSEPSENEEDSNEQSNGGNSTRENDEPTKVPPKVERKTRSLSTSRINLGVLTALTSLILFFAT